MSVSAVTAARAETSQPQSDDYVVRSGDTLSGIADRSGVSLSALIAANPQISNPHVIRPGQTVTIPEGGGADGPAPSTYTVRSGDTLSAIGDRFNVDWRIVAQQNDIANPNRIQPGDRLTISGGTTSTAEAPASPTRPAPSAGTGAQTPAATGASGLSEAGVQALYNREAQANVSNRLHWPGGASGVTVEPGYDLKGRTAASVVADLTSVGVDAASARRVAEGAGLSGTAASHFASANRDAVDLTPTQERALLDKAMIPYAQAVRDNVKVPLTQNQYDSLVSFTYNIGVGGFEGSTTLRRLNAGDASGAADAMAMWNKSDGRVSQGLINRRNAEITQFNTPSGPAQTPGAAPTTAAAPTPAAPAANGSPAAYADIIRTQGSAQARADLDAGKAVLLGVRSQSNFTVNGGEGEYNDTMVLVRKSGDGYTAQTFRLNTEPSSQYLAPGRANPPDVNGDGRGDLGQLQAGQTVQYQRGSFLNNRALLAVGNQTNTVERDLNRDGAITSADRTQRVQGASGMHIHIGGTTDTYSMGCQTLPRAEHNRFFNALDALPQQSRFSYVLVNAGS